MERETKKQTTEPTAGMQAINVERERQIKDDGLTLKKGDAYIGFELKLAAECYFMNNPSKWPWPHYPWTPRPRLEQLAIAGALFLAEIARVERLAERMRCLSRGPGGEDDEGFQIRHREIKNGVSSRDITDGMVRSLTSKVRMTAEWIDRILENNSEENSPPPDSHE